MNRGQTVRWVGCVAIVSTSACHSVDGTGATADTTMTASRVDATLLMDVAASPVPERVCNQSAIHVRPAVLLSLSAKECLSCQNIGRFMRDLERRVVADTQPSGVVLLVPRSDTALVCSYLRIERVRSPVMALSADQYRRAVPDAHSEATHLCNLPSQRRGDRWRPQASGSRQRVSPQYRVQRRRYLSVRRRLQLGGLP